LVAEKIFGSMAS